jgi:enamine deaminase RidA (YjgF/YER057c/UK114 family)
MMKKMIVAILLGTALMHVSVAEESNPPVEPANTVEPASPTVCSNNAPYGSGQMGCGEQENEIMQEIMQQHMDTIKTLLQNPCFITDASDYRNPLPTMFDFPIARWDPCGPR